MDIRNGSSSLLDNYTTTVSNQNSTAAQNVTGTVRLDNIIIPTGIAIVGIIGNSITFLTIVLTDLRKSYVNKYLLVLLISDSAALLKITLERLFNVRMLSFRVCWLGQYFWNVPIYISNLTVVLLTAERFLAVIFPLKHMQYHHVDRWKLILAVVIAVLVMNLNHFAVLQENRGADAFKGKCVYNNSLPLAKPLFLIPRMAVSFLLPLGAVLLVNISIVLKLRARSIIQQNDANSSSTQDARTNNKVLFLIPLFYVLLNTPYNAHLAFVQFWHKGTAISTSWNLIMLYIFFLNFATNFVFYAFASKLFRNALLRLWIQRWLKSEQTGREANSQETQETHL